MNEEILRKIRNFADQAHGTQLRKYTHDRYIVHPERVMRMCAEYTDSTIMLAAALLHDVLEDTETTQQEILSFLSQLMNMSEAQETLKLVVELTDVYEKKNYPDWNRRRRKQMEAERLSKVSSEAQSIKYADILDNSHEIMQHDYGFGIKFSKECKMILEKMTKGHPDLRERACLVVESNLAKVK